MKEEEIYGGNCHLGDDDDVSQTNGPSDLVVIRKKMATNTGENNPAEEGEGEEESALGPVATAVPVYNGAASASAANNGDIVGLEKIPRCSMRNLTVIMTRSVENAFYSFGLWIGRNPYKTVLGSLLFCAACSSGMLTWYTLTDDEYLWTPYGSEFQDSKRWIDKNFPPDIRYELLIMTAPNVLTPDVIQYLWKIHDEVRNATTKDGRHDFAELCIEDLETKKDCITQSLLNVWNSDSAVINELTPEVISKDVTKALKEPKSALPKLLENISYDSEGKVVGATSLMNVWLMEYNAGEKVEGQALSDPTAEDWEEDFVSILVGSNKPEDKPDGVTVYCLATKSFMDELDDAMQSNQVVLYIGCALILFYIALVLGRLNSLEQRVFLSLMGMLVIGFSIGASFGVCFFMRIFYADMHPTIPFLMLGIGVDDMFVVVQALENLKPKEKKLPVEQRVALTMKSAGVSITVTSLTDIGAFLIGSTTRLPILRTFCLFCAMGVLMLYIFAVTFFAGCVVLDERRIDARKWAWCAKSKPPEWRPNECSQRNPGKVLVDRYLAKWMLKNLPVKVAALAGVFVMFGFGVYGTTQIDINYSSIWYLRKSSYQSHFYKALSEHFPDSGERVMVYVGGVRYWEHGGEMRRIQAVMDDSDYIRNGTVSYWFDDFYREYCLEDEGGGGGGGGVGGGSDFWGDDSFFEGVSLEEEKNCTDELAFKRRFLTFLNDNRNYFPDLKFNVSLENASRADLWNGGFEITASRASFQHCELENTTIQNTAMEQIKSGMGEIVFSGEEFRTPIPHTFMYVQWEANKIISQELIRNLSLAFATIVLVTLVLMANLRVSFFVLVCVVMTVVNVCGYSHFMGITIEIVTSIILILSCGLALDYAAHIGVAYMCSKETTRNGRAHDALVSMGCAVFHGGFSTFTAFVLTCTSDSYVFNTFFKMFALVVLFGLVHGLVLLPICLSLVGPLPYIDEDEKKGDVELAAASNGNGHLRMGNGTTLSRKSEQEEEEASKPLNGDAAVNADSATA